jgi:hypothetical protein
VRFRITRFLGLAFAFGLLALPGRGQRAVQTTSLNSEVVAVPASEAVVIDGRDDDWDLSAGVWSYNAPDLVGRHSVWTHLMWDERGLYYLARIHDLDPLKNATKGADFDRGWRGDAVQLRLIFDERTPDEHQMHLTLYHSTAENRPYLIVKHGGHKARSPYDDTGPNRPDLLERFGETMDAAGGRIATRAWDDGKGYNIEVFMPWSYLRLSGRPLAAGDQFVFGWETLWAKPTRPGELPDTSNAHRLADGVKNAKANRIFMFRARNDWGRGVIAAKGSLAITDSQRELQQARLAAFSNFSTTGSVAISYELPKGADRDVTIAIENTRGERVRNLLGQYPRPGGKVTDHWDGLDDAGRPVAPGLYTAIVVDHEPIKLELFTSLYNAGTPPWGTEAKNVTWGSDHGAASAIATHGDRVVAGFSLPEAGRGMCSLKLDGGAEWSTRNSAGDLAITDEFIYSFEFDVWSKRFLVSRIEPATGRVVPFVRPDGEQLVSKEIPVVLRELGLTGTQTAVTEGVARLAYVQRASFAFGGGALWLLIPGEILMKINPVTAEISEKRPPGGLIGLRGRDGRLYGVFNDKSLWALDDSLGKKERLLDLSSVRTPGRIAISQDFERLAVCDTGTNQVLIFDLSQAAGKTAGRAVPIVSIGKAKLGLTDRTGGPFDRNDVMLPVSADFDAEGRLWVAEGTVHVHRTSVWKPDGTFADEYWGSSPYGATTGYKLEFDASRFIAMGVEFRIDERTDFLRKKSAETPLFYHPYLNTSQGTIYRVKDGRGHEHEFAVAAPGGLDNRALVIYRRDQRGEFVPAAGLFGPITNPTRRARTPLSDQLKDSKESRGWVDRNGDTRIDADELVSDGVDFVPLYWSSGWVRPDMTILTPGMVMHPLGSINAHGVPVYDFSKPLPVPNPISIIDRGNSWGTPVIDRAGNISNGIEYHTVDGRRGSYPNRFRRHDAPAAQRGLLIAPFRTNGVVEDIPGVGSATMLQGDRGEWFMLSMDGLYITSLFQDIKGKLTMDATLIDGESFGGHFWRVTDGPMKGRVLVQSGKTNYAIFEVKNLNTIRRQTVALTVSADDIARGQIFAAAGDPQGGDEKPLVLTKVEKLPSSAPSAELPREAALVDGLPFTLVQEAGNPARWFKVTLLADAMELAVIWQVADPSPWRNGADLFTHAFAGGDAVDLKLLSPTHGPIRLLAAPINGRAQAVYWRQSAPATENAQTYVVANNPSNARRFDVVKLLGSAKTTAKTGAGGYTVLVRVPLTELGLDPTALPGKLQGLAGVIFSDAAGTNRVARLYWHDKATGMVNDIPTESAIEPAKFGEISVRR